MLKADPARKNIETTRGTVPIERASYVPLDTHPDGIEWRRETRDWWELIWSSGLAVMWTPTDIQTLRRAALLDDLFWRETDPLKRAKLQTGIVATTRLLGLDPMSRRALQWTVKPPSEDRASVAARSEPTPIRRDPRSAK